MRRERSAGGGLNRAVGRPFESRDVDTLHLHHRLEGALGAARIGIAEKGRKFARHDLPGQTIAILDPAALLSLWNRRERIGQALDLGLRLDRNLKRDGLVELEVRPAIEPDERAAPSA